MFEAIVGFFMLPIIFWICVSLFIIGVFYNTIHENVLTTFCWVVTTLFFVFTKNHFSILGFLGVKNRPWFPWS